MGDDADLYKDDLYGDLDLEDLDATQLDEELVDPPDLEPAPSTSSQQASTAPPPQAQQVQPSAQQYGQSSQPAMQGQGQQDDGMAQGIDRIRPSDMPDEGKMFIGGLNWETTDDGLRAYMAKFGDIDACTIMRDPSGRSRGFAFLTYTNASSVTQVLSQVHTLDGKQIDPKRAIPRAEHEKTAKVFVGGLAPGVTSESLRSFLSQFGEVLDATVMFDRETGRSKGFAFATFADEQTVGIAMNASGIELEGKQIEIKKAQPRGSGNLVKNFNAPSPRSYAPPGQQGMGNFGGMGGAMGGGGGFDPNAMAMMYQNMMKTNMGGANMGMGFDPNAMAMMYQNMMKNMGGMNAPAINPNMAMRNGMGMNMMGMGNMGGMGMMGGMGGMGGMAGMGNMGVGVGGMGGMGFQGQAQAQMGAGRGAMAARPVPNAPRGPAAMRGPGTAAPAPPTGPGAQRYSTQGSARAKPY